MCGGGGGGGGGDTSGRPDCGQIVVSCGCHQFSWKTFTSHVLAKSTTIFILILLRGSFFMRAWNQPASKVDSLMRRHLRGDESRNTNGCFQMGDLSTFLMSAKYIFKPLQNYSKLYILCLSQPAYFLVHVAPQVKQKVGLGNQVREKSLTRCPHPA